VRLLGAHEFGCTEDHALLGEHHRAGPHLPLRDLGKTEVQNLGEIPDATLGGQEDVFWLEVAVNDARLVRFFEGAAHLDHDAYRALRVQRAFGSNELREVLADEVLHHEVASAVVELTIEKHARGVGVRELTHRARLATEAGNQVTAREIARVEDLDRHVAIHIGLLGFVDGPHAALADLLDDAELPSNLLVEIWIAHGTRLASEMRGGEERPMESKSTLVNDREA